MKNDKQKTVFTRRDFFAYLIPALSIPALVWWMLTGSRDKAQLKSVKTIAINGSVPAGMSLQEGIILVKSEDTVQAFEAKCTHLGCSIKKIEGDELVCSCHGSRFNREGKAIRGPAINSLKELEVEQDLVSGNLIIQMR